MSNLAFNFPRDTFLGFDQLFNTLTEINPDVARGSGYPPYNVIKKDDGHFLIEIAVAGFSKHDIDLTLEGGVLTVTGMVGAPACGDVMRLQIKIEDNIVTDAKFKTYGCGSAIASSSLLTEWVKGMNVSDVDEIKNSQIADALALPPVKIHCSVLAEDAIKSAVADYRNKQLKEK